MASRIILFLLPAVAFARINVDLGGTFNGNDQSNLALNFDGHQIDIISDEERNTFNLNDNSLKNAVSDYFGKRPDDAYLKSPTPWGDLYKTYGWDQVTRTLRPRNGRIVGINSTPVVVMEQVFENNSTKDATFNVGISQEVANTVSSSWSTGGSLTVGQEISYGFDIEVANGGGTTSFSYTSSWGKNYEKSQTVTVGATSSMEMTLKPGQSVVAQLMATRGSIQIEMEYEASLSGDSAVNYSDPYKGHHFWALDVNGVMNAGGISNSKVSRETLEIGFYASSKVVVHDRFDMMMKLMEVNF